MKILIVANINSIFTYELINELKKKKPDYIIDIYSIRKPYTLDKYKRVFNEIYFSDLRFEFLFKIPILKTFLSVLFFKFFLLKTKYKEYDIVNIHYVEYHSYFNINSLKRISKKVIPTIYGSDFWVVNKMNDKLLYNTLKKSDVVSCTNSIIEDIIKKSLPKLNIKTVRFGLTPLGEINNLSKETAQQFFPNLKDKFIITCGYHANRNNNHLKVLKAIANVKKDLPSNYIIILQIAYSRKADYIKEIKKLVIDLDLNCFYIENLLPIKELASIRVLSDLSIQALETDSFSGTLQEYLYTENVLITGSWLPYKLFKEKGVFYETIDNFNELESKIQYCIANYIDLKKKSKINKEIIWDLSSWEKNINDWVELYN